MAEKQVKEQARGTKVENKKNKWRRKQEQELTFTKSKREREVEEIEK